MYNEKQISEMRRLFNLSKAGLESQEYRKCTSSVGGYKKACVLRNPRNERCAIGWMIGSPGIDETRSNDSILLESRFPEFIKKMRHAHDDSVSSLEMKRRIEAVGKFFGL